MDYVLFEKKAVEILINRAELQSTDYELGDNFIKYLRGELDTLRIDGIYILPCSKGIIFSGSQLEKTFLVLDLVQCKNFDLKSNSDFLMTLQKIFRFAVRYWSKQAFTNSEKIVKNKGVIFPFPFSAKSSYRVVIERAPYDKRLHDRGINDTLLVYKAGTDGIQSGTEEIPQLGIYKKAGMDFLKNIADIRQYFINKDSPQNEKNDLPLEIYKTDSVRKDHEFKYLNYNKQMDKLTITQGNIVNCENMDAPIRIEGPAGTGKTVALILRAITMLKKKKEKDEDAHFIFILHSKSTELAVKQMIINLIPNTTEWVTGNAKQHITIETLQEFCIKYISLNESQIIDLDASESKQYQLMLVLDAYKKNCSSVFNTYKPLLSRKCVEYFLNEDENKIAIMLQYEFSVRIKGMSESDFELYKKLPIIDTGIPMEKEEDKEFIFKIFRDYQSQLEDQSVYDTDDIILEALARLNAPIWRRERAQKGFDYIFADEVHLFNLNEQHIFHLLTKDVIQKTIPICFALDYGQIIGERVGLQDSYVEQVIADGAALKQSLNTIFRNSPQIMDLCASLTASGALLFKHFINPYNKYESSFTAVKENKCDVPMLVMYDNDTEMRNSVEGHITAMINKYKCIESDILVVCFDYDIFKEHFAHNIGKYNVLQLDGKNQYIQSDSEMTSRRKITCALPEYINGLEFKCVILIGVDEGRVPQNAVHDISQSFIKYSALNKLYISCSRAAYEVLILGSNSRGVSSCLKHSLENHTLRKAE